MRSLVAAAQYPFCPWSTIGTLSTHTSPSAFFLTFAFTLVLETIPFAAVLGFAPPFGYIVTRT